MQKGGQFGQFIKLMCVVVYYFVQTYYFDGANDTQTGDQNLDTSK